MPEDNRVLLEKAEMVVSDLTTGGYLVPEQASEYIRLAIKGPVLLQRCTVIPMSAPKMDVPTIQFAGQVLRPGTEATPLAAAEWASPTLGMPELNCQLFRAELPISEEVLEDQIERGTFRETLMNGMAEATGRDIEKVIIQGDIASGDALLAKLDGILKQAGTYVVNASSASLDKSVLKSLEKVLPDEFSTSSNLHFFTNRQAKIDYRDSLADRATSFGDAMLLSNGDPPYSDSKVVGVPMFPVAGGLTNVLYGDAKGICVGFYRKIKMKIGEDVSAGLVRIVITVRFDVKLVTASAFPKAINVVGA